MVPVSFQETKYATQEADKFAEEDKKKADLVESKNRFEQISYQLEKTRDENKDKLSDDDKKIVPLSYQTLIYLVYAKK